MSSSAPRTFAEFWPYYIGEHRNPRCRTLHYVGTTLAVLGLVCAVLVSRWFLLAAVISGYLFAWIGHFFVEFNKPATFKYPLWSLAADFKMWWLAIQGTIDAEVTRLYGSPNPPPDAPLRL